MSVGFAAADVERSARMRAIEPFSKRLSFWLRHRPDAAGLTLDRAGWAEIASVLQAFERSGLNCDYDCLKEVIERNDKQRFEISDDGTRIRARQGHSVAVEIGWPPADPPELLYHGTVQRFLPAILSQGLRAMKRHHVHLSPDIATAASVGSRRGTAVILEVRADDLARTGQQFFVSSNGVWLTAEVPPTHIRKL